jgi:hypothetical protein
MQLLKGMCLINFLVPTRKEKNYAGSEKPLPTLINEKEPLSYRVL